MKKALILATVLFVPASAYAGFSMKDAASGAMMVHSGGVNTEATPAAAPVQKPTTTQLNPPATIAPATMTATPPAMTVTTIERHNSTPSLQIINERYVPDDIKKKYQMGDDSIEMNTANAPQPPTVIEAQPIAPQPQPQPQQQLPVPAPQMTTTEVITGPVHTINVTPPPGSVLPAAPTPLTVADVPPVPVAKPVGMKSLIIEDSVPKAPPIPVPPERYETWRARKGELLKDVLQRWAARSGTDFVWTAAESPKISDEFSYVGTFEDATTQLMAKNSGSLKMKFAADASQAKPDQPVSINMKEQPVSLQTSSLQTPGDDDMSGGPILLSDPAEVSMPDDMGMTAESAVPASSENKNWYASNGASLKAVLEAWAETEGASVVWQTKDNFAVRKSINEKKGFEDAVADILTQYDTQKHRPVGQLYRNPVTGEKVLVIKTDSAG